MRKTIISLMVSVMVLAASVVCVNADTKNATGYLPSPYQSQGELRLDGKSSLNKANGLPAKYDGRTLPYASKVAIKNQNPLGLCWAFSASTCMEISYMHQQMLAGKTPVYKRLSPYHFGYFFWNRVTDPLGGTAGDSNWLAAGEAWNDFGGNVYYTSQALANWGGMTLESKVPFNAKGTSVDTKYAYDNQTILKEAKYLPCDFDAVKEAVYENGAVVVSIHMDDRYLNTTTGGYYVPSSKNTNHEVVIVGWDDNYSRSNFRNSSSVEMDGAWIVQNSWGPEWGKKGYFYVSYDTYGLDTPVELVSEAAVEHDFNYQYDGSACPAYSVLDSGAKEVNFYTAAGSSQEIIDEVGFTISDAYADEVDSFTIEIYKNASRTSDLTASKRVASFDVTTEGGGIFTFDVPTEVKLAKGDKFAVVITSKSDDVYFGVDMSTDSDGDMGFTSATKSGQSYYGTSYGTWYDNDDEEICARIKVLTSDTSKTKVEDTTDDFGPSGPTIDPDEPEDPDVPDRDIDVVRIAGNTRYETSTLIATERQKELSSGGRYDVIIVANGANYPDALAGGYLANTNEACLVIVDKAREASVQTYIRNHLASNGKVYILGGTNAVSKAFEDKVRSFVCPEGNVERLGGNTRYETNMKILDKEGIYEDTILICSASGFADSLSASATHYPILLVGSSLSSEQIKFLKKYDDIENALIIGGTGAVSSTVESQLEKLYPGSVDRLAGSSRYETSYLVAMKFKDTENPGFTPSCITLAYGKNFPDGLSGGPLAYSHMGPLILVDDNNTKYAQKYARNAEKLSEVYVLGGSGLVSDNAVYRILH